MIQTRIDATKLRASLRKLESWDKDVVKNLRKDMRSQISPMAKQVASGVPDEPPLSNFGGDRATSWSKVRPSVSFTPGKGRRNAKFLVSIRIAPQSGRRGLYIAELAGSRSSGRTGQGRAMIRNLNRRYPMQGKGGRFAYKKFRSLRPTAQATAYRILRSSTSKLNRALGI